MRYYLVILDASRHLRLLTILSFRASDLSLASSLRRLIMLKITLLRSPALFGTRHEKCRGQGPSIYDKLIRYKGKNAENYRFSNLGKSWRIDADRKTNVRFVISDLESPQKHFFENKFLKACSYLCLWGGGLKSKNFCTPCDGRNQIMKNFLATSLIGLTKGRLFLQPLYLINTSLT